MLTRLELPIVWNAFADPFQYQSHQYRCHQCVRRRLEHKSIVSLIQAIDTKISICHIIQLQVRNRLALEPDKCLSIAEAHDQRLVARLAKSLKFYPYKIDGRTLM